MRATSIVAIGNSITYHPPRSDVDWSGDWGMAATSMANDYSHVLARRLGIPVVAQNFAGLELDPDTYLPYMPQFVDGITPSSLVVVELGDNVQVGGIAKFAQAYAALLSAVGSPARLVCTSTWWGNTEVDAVILSSCESKGGFYAYIGDIRAMHLDPSGMFTNAAVDDHPHDAAMAQIAGRIASAAGG